MRGALLAFAYGLAVVVAGACGEVTAAKVAPPPFQAGPERIALVRGGIPVSFAEGEGIPVGGDLEAVVRFNRLPGIRYLRVLRISLAAASRPAADAVISVSGEMRYMDHGAFRTLAESAGDGSYVASLPFAMPGEWRLVLDVRTATARGEISLDFDEYD